VPSRQDEFAGLVQKYARVLGSAIRRVCSRRYRSLIPDIEQEVYIALWKRLEGGKEIEHPASYLYKVALTTALAVVRKHAPETTAIEAHEETLAEPAGNPFGNLLPAERTRLLGEVLEQLPLEQARAVRAHLAGFDHTEVANLFGWTESVARHRIYRGIESLREKMTTEAGRTDGRAARQG
jgi:RNA polymerase sigma-70 factor, ECF subfamily